MLVKSITKYCYSVLQRDVQQRCR